MKLIIISIMVLLSVGSNAQSNVDSIIIKFCAKQPRPKDRNGFIDGDYWPVIFLGYGMQAVAIDSNYHIVLKELDSLSALKLIISLYFNQYDEIKKVEALKLSLQQKTFRKPKKHK